MSACDPSCACHAHGAPPLGRRGFVRLAGAAGALAALRVRPVVAGPFEPAAGIDHFIPADKKLSAEWVRALFAKGARTWYSGDDLKTIGMPVGGVCAGQVYLAGDGRLVYWDIFNRNLDTGYGQVNYKVGREPEELCNRARIFREPPVEQGFVVRVKAGGAAHVRTLDRKGFPGVRFCGEYPIGHVDYADPAFPVAVALEAFSPFIPLDTDDSALPAIVMRFTVRNPGAAEAEVSIAGWLQNAVLKLNAEAFAGSAVRESRVVREEAFACVLGGVKPLATPAAPPRPPVLFADFEGDDYGTWTVEGGAFGKGPARGTLAGQQPVDGFSGKGLVNTFLGGDVPTGKLVSPAFTIERPWIGFLIGGGSQEKKTCVNLVVDGKVVRSAIGRDEERLAPHAWSVKDLAGKEARIEIVDRASGPWGHVNVDQIEFRDTPVAGAAGDLATRPDFGTMAVAVLGRDGAEATASIPDGDPGALLFKEAGLASDPRAEKSLDETLRGAVARTVKVPPGGTKTIDFVLAWSMPNLYRDRRRVGNYYAKRFPSAADVVRHVAANLDRLAGQTRLWHDTYYDATLPWWLLDRLHATAANLATTTCQWWEDGRFWAWEGCGCCHGTCGHVWNYAHTMARLFPVLERSVREKQDFAPGVGFVEATGEIRFRGEGWGMWAGDSQGGYVLKAYREHLCSLDDAFLKAHWPRIRKAVEFLLKQDVDGDGLIEGKQHQTYDQDYYGPNTFVGALYLGALRAAEAMALQMGDKDFAATCRTVFEAGSKKSVELLFNGEYFVQKVDLEQRKQWQYGDGCLADQLFGQGWAHQVGLGYLYPREKVLSALKAIWAYCWAPDIGPQNKAHAPERWFAYPGEGGLFTCTWPKGKHLGPTSTRYRDEMWTGIEYQVASHMAWEGMLTEALAVCRAIHERYHPSKHNPWNEIECGDHYARALASWGVLTGLAGFEYDGPARHLGFAPRMTPERFRCAFTGAEGWGTIDQKRNGRKQVDAVEVKWGVLPIETLALETTKGLFATSITVTVAGRKVEAHFRREGPREEGSRVVVMLPKGTTVKSGEAVVVEVSG
jgi:uncharacterized protein (DUF608 family)